MNQQADRLSCWLSRPSLPLQARLDVADVMCGLRPAARVLIPAIGHRDVELSALVETGLAIAVARGMKWQARRSSIGCVDWSAAASSETDPFVVLYVGRDETAASSARTADEGADDSAFGETLGYPSCCTEWVCRRGAVPALAESFKLYAPDGHYACYAWPASMAVDAPLTPHFPCSRSCAPSQRLALGRWIYLQEIQASQPIERIRWAANATYHLLSSGEVRAGAPADKDANVIASAHPDPSICLPDTARCK
jgi:hypothetical protein